MPTSTHLASAGTSAKSVQTMRVSPRRQERDETVTSWTTSGSLGAGAQVMELVVLGRPVRGIDAPTGQDAQAAVDLLGVPGQERHAVGQRDRFDRPPQRWRLGRRPGEADVGRLTLPAGVGRRRGTQAEARGHLPGGQVFEGEEKVGALLRGDEQHRPPIGDAVGIAPQEHLKAGHIADVGELIAVGMDDDLTAILQGAGGAARVSQGRCRSPRGQPFGHGAQPSGKGGPLHDCHR